MCIQPVTLYYYYIFLYDMRVYIYTIIYVKKNWMDIDVCRCDLYGVRYIVSVVRHHNSPASCQRDAFISSRTITSKSNLWNSFNIIQLPLCKVFSISVSKKGPQSWRQHWSSNRFESIPIIKCQPMLAAFEPHMHTGRQCPSSHRLWRWSTWYTQRHQRGRGQQDKLSLKGFCKIHLFTKPKPFLSNCVRACVQV